MQGTPAYIGSEQQLGVRTPEKETREMVDLLPCRLRSICRKARESQQDEAANSDGVLEKALLSAYQHSSKLQGPVQMSTWLTAIALLILGPDRAKAQAPTALNEITESNLAVADSSKREK